MLPRGIFVLFSLQFRIQDHSCQLALRRKRNVSKLIRHIMWNLCPLLIAMMMTIMGYRQFVMMPTITIVIAHQVQRDHGQNFFLQELKGGSLPHFSHHYFLASLNGVLESGRISSETKKIKTRSSRALFFVSYTLLIPLVL